MLEIKAEGKDLRTWLNDHVSGMKSVEMKERGAIDLDTKAAKGFIYAAKNSADFSTLEHEFQHLWAVTDKKASENLAKVMHSVADDKRFQEYVANHKDVVKMKVDDVIDTMRKMGEDASKWTRDEAEVVATLYELYKQNGKTFNEKLKNIFEQIAEWFHRIYQALKREGMLNEELIKAYDAYFDKDAEFRKTAEKAEQKAEIKNQEAPITFYQFNKEIQEYASIKEADQTLKSEIDKLGGVQIEKGIVRMDVSSVTDLYKLADEAKEEFSKTVSDLAKQLGVRDVSFRKGLKKNGRVVAKTLNDYEGDIGRVLDVNGATPCFRS